jgi:hypothetical protein
LRKKVLYVSLGLVIGADYDITASRKAGSSR